MVKAVVFDLDGTLYDREATVPRFAVDQHRRLGLGKSGLGEAEYAARFAELDARGRAWKDKVYATLAAEFSTGPSAAELLADYEGQYCLHCKPSKGLEPMLLTLKRQGMRLGLVTNGLTDFQERTFRALGIKHLFDTAIVSEAVGFRKPDPRIFQMALGRLGVEADEAVFVGDDPLADIVGAKSAGMTAIWVRSSYHGAPPEADAIIEAIADLPAALSSALASKAN